MRTKKTTVQTPNDQGLIIEAIKNKDYYAAWEKVKWVGSKDITSIDERYLIFQHAVQLFNPYINNNFIYFYKRHLKGYDLNQDNTYYVTDTKSILNKLKQDYISPENRSKLTEELKKWSQ